MRKPSHVRPGLALERGGRRDSSSDEAGLGLAIVSEIVAASGGTLVLVNVERGLRVSIRLPAA